MKNDDCKQRLWPICVHVYVHVMFDPHPSSVLTSIRGAIIQNAVANKQNMFSALRIYVYIL